MADGERKDHLRHPRYAVILADDGTELARFLLDKRDTANPFSSGKFGFSSSDKAMLRTASGEDKRHQCSINLVEIVPKPKA